MGADWQRESANEKLGANVRILRERKGISQAELARLMTDRGWPWHQSTVYRVESGKQTVGFPEAVDLAAILRTSLDRLTWGSAEANETEFVYAAGARLNQHYELTANAIRHQLANLAAAERMLARAPTTDTERVKEAREDVAARVEQYSLDAAIEEGVRRYEERAGGEESSDDAPEATPPT